MDVELKPLTLLEITKDTPDRERYITRYKYTKSVLKSLILEYKHNSLAPLLNNSNLLPRDRYVRISKHFHLKYLIRSLHIALSIFRGKSPDAILPHRRSFMYVGDPLVLEVLKYLRYENPRERLVVIINCTVDKVIREDLYARALRDFTRDYSNNPWSSAPEITVDRYRMEPKDITSIYREMLTNGLRHGDVICYWPDKCICMYDTPFSWISKAIASYIKRCYPD